jgi:membrane protease YdiL (CAAX protease family)
MVLGIARVFETALFISIASLLGNQGLSTIGIHRNHLHACLKRGLLWSLGFGFLVGVVFGILYFLGVDPFVFMKTNMPASPVDILLFFLVGALISPIAEEIFFRGILYGFFRRWGVWIAIGASTLLFVIAHAASSGRIPFSQIIGGLLFALAYEKEKNLVVPIVIHVLGNAAIFTLGIVA